MAIVPAQPVPPPEPLGTRYGLFTVAAGPLELPEHGRAGGIVYEPVSCGSARIYPADCHTEPDAPQKPLDPGDPLTEAVPFAVYATYLCGSAGRTADQVRQRVRRRLENGEQGAVEGQLATLLDDQVTADGTALTPPDATDIVSVFGELEDWLYTDQGYGSIGYLHAPIRAASYVDQLVVRDGPVWRTRLGTRVVFGSYPDGTVYVSGHVTVWRSPEISLPPPEQTFNRGANQWTALAEREYAVSWDCAVASAPFDHGAVS